MNLKALVAVLLMPSVALAGSDAVTTRPLIPVPQLKLDYVPPPLIPVPAGDDKIVHVEMGEPAPFTGQLYDPATSLRWAHYLQQAKLRLRVDVLAEREQCNAYLQYMGRRIDLEVTYSDAVEQDLRARVLELEQRNVDLSDEVQNPGFFKSPGFWFGVGVLATGLTVGLGVLVGSQVN